MSDFSNNLKFLREQKNLSQNKLAELANVNQTTIARWENEEISPSLDNIYDVATALNISIADITGKDLRKEAEMQSGKISLTPMELLFNKSKTILSDDDIATIEFIMKKAIEKYEKQKNNE